MMFYVTASSWAAHWPKVLSFLKLMKLRVGIFFTMFLVMGYLSTGNVQWYVLAMGLIGLPVLLAFDRAINIYTDRIEDSINNPYRVKIAEFVGYEVIGALSLASYLASMIGALLVAVLLNYTAALVIVIAVHLALFYSWGLRLKRYLIFALLVPSMGAVVCPFVGGWVLGESLASISPIIYVLGYHRFVHSAILTFPDAEGDKAAGVKTLFTSSLARYLTVVIPLIVFSPYAFVALLVWLGVLEARFLLILSLLPLAAILNLVILRLHGIRDRARREIVWESNQMYLFVFYAVLLSIYYPSPTAWLILGLLAVTYYLVSGFDARISEFNLKKALVGVVYVLRAVPAHDTRG